MMPGMASYCRPSAPVVYEVLMTPPVSPGHSEDGTDASLMMDQGQYAEKPSSQEPQLPRLQTPVLQTTYPHWQRDPHQALTPPPRPARSLENEQVHVEKPGVLKLTDFEVRGTLGKVSSSLLGSHIAYCFSQALEHLVASSWFVSSQQLPDLRTSSP